MSAEGDPQKPFVGKVWPNDAVYPDFLNPKAVEIWGKWLSFFYKVLGFDGIWADMNEATNYCDGECYPRQVPKEPKVKN